MEFDTGFGVGGGGYDFGIIRAEGEITYRTNDVDSFSGFGVSVGGGGEDGSLSLLLNVFFDLETETAFSPYVGVRNRFCQSGVERSENCWHSFS